MILKSSLKPVEGTSDPWPIMFELLISLLVDRKAHLNNGRVNAFLHRIIITAKRVNDQTGVKSGPFVLPLLLVVRQILVHHRYAFIPASAYLSSKFMFTVTIFGRNSGRIYKYENLLITRSSTFIFT